jgi:hypothetical protein
MRLIVLIFVSVIVSACGSSGSENNESEGVFSPQENVDTSDIEGHWVNACVESDEYENHYKREFLDYKSGTIINSENEISFGHQNFSDFNCSLAPVSDPGNLTNVVYIPQFEGVGTNFISAGTYTNTDGIESKVIELNDQVNNSSRLAYYINESTLYFSFQNNSGYTFDYAESYRSTE